MKVMTRIMTDTHDGGSGVFAWIEDGSDGVCKSCGYISPARSLCRFALNVSGGFSSSCQTVGHQRLLQTATGLMNLQLLIPERERQTERQKRALKEILSVCLTAFFIISDLSLSALTCRLLSLTDPPTPRPVNQSETCLSSPLTPTRNSHILPVLSTKHTHKPAHAQTNISNKRHLSLF